METLSQFNIEWQENERVDEFIYRICTLLVHPELSIHGIKDTIILKSISTMEETLKMIHDKLNEWIWKMVPKRTDDEIKLNLLAIIGIQFRMCENGERCFNEKFGCIERMPLEELSQIFTMNESKQ